MNANFFRCLPFILLLFSLRALAAPSYLSKDTDDLSTEEQNELDQRIEDFYNHPNDPGQMDHKIPKYSLTKKRFVEPNPWLHEQASFVDNSLSAAGLKASPEYFRYRCTKFLKKRFPGLRCDDLGTWSTVESDDDVADLVHTWIPKSELIYDMGDLPRKGKVENQGWSGDYWRSRWGVTSYRYATGIEYKKYESAVAAYEQPSDWQNAQSNDTDAQLLKRILAWSPSEKYDLTVGDEKFTLTNEQKAEGEDEIEKGNVPEWFGICDGWATASIFAPAPVSSVKTTGPGGVKVTWYPEDIRAMASLAWANGDYPNNFIGGRCEAKKPKKFANGRLSQQECFDTNPATLTLALANLIGNARQAFVMDSAFDAEVWNQPIISYSLKYFNPLHPKQRSHSWEKEAVDYDDSFKAKDRFQKPLTRGDRSRGDRYDDSGIDKIVGVIASVVYLTEVDAVHSETPPANDTVRVTYTYDLELREKHGKYYPTGGEWHDNAHPDFLWIPEKGSVAWTNHDKSRVSFLVDHEPDSTLTRAARKASADGYPLCTVLQGLLAHSSGKSSYRCE